MPGMKQSLAETIRRVVRFQFVAMMVLCLGLCASARAQGQITLGWDASPDTNVAGYLVQYGTSSGVYSLQVDGGTNVVDIITDLTEGATYYFVVIAYDGNGVQSVPSGEISYNIPTIPTPVFSPVANQTVNVGQNLIVTNLAIGSDGGSDNLSFSLLSAPGGMQINSANGILSWIPSLAQAGSTNLVTMQVADTNTPPLTSTQSFTVVVGNIAPTILPAGVISVGQSGSINLNMAINGAVTFLIFTLDAPAGSVSSVTVQSLVPQNVTISQDPPGAAHSYILVEVGLGQVLPAQLQLQVNLTTTSNQVSSFGALQVSALAAYGSDGTAYTPPSPSTSRLVFVGADSLMDLQVNAGSGNLTVYGPAGASYQIQSTTALTGGAAWTNEFSTTLATLCQTFPNLPVIASGNKFYRAQRL
jgi:Putative Ig domain/Fibronectin type III domain